MEHNLALLDADGETNLRVAATKQSRRCCASCIECAAKAQSSANISSCITVSKHKFPDCCVVNQVFRLQFTKIKEVTICTINQGDSGVAGLESNV